MPELPEVETVRRGLARAMEGRRIDGVRVARRDLRRPLPPDFEERLIGRTVTAVGRRAKYLTIDLDDGGVLLAHLGMSGRMIVDENGPDTQSSRRHADHEHVTFVLGNRTFVRFADPRRFGILPVPKNSLVCSAADPRRLPSMEQSMVAPIPVSSARRKAERMQTTP